jgi:hypothetical protein
MQHMLLPQTRNEEYILLLRAAAVPADRGFRTQPLDGLSNNMANTLDKLEEECSLSSPRIIQSWTRKEEARAEAVKITIQLYKEQASRDYQLLCTAREQNIVLAHLAHKQSLENLELNKRILELLRQ